MNISEFHNHELCNSNTALLHGKESQKFQLDSHTWKILLYYSSKKDKFCYQSNWNKASRFPKYKYLIIQVVEHTADKDKKNCEICDIMEQNTLGLQYSREDLELTVHTQPG